MLGNAQAVIVEAAEVAGGVYDTVTATLGEDAAEDAAPVVLIVGLAVTVKLTAKEGLARGLSELRLESETVDENVTSVDAEKENDAQGITLEDGGGVTV